MKSLLTTLLLACSSLCAVAQGFSLNNATISGSLISQTNDVILSAKANADDGVTKTPLTVKNLLNYFGASSVKPASVRFFFTENGIVLADKSGSPVYGTLIQTSNSGASIFLAKKGYTASPATFLAGVLTGEVNYALFFEEKKTRLKISFLGHKASDSNSSTEQVLTGTLSGEFKGSL